MPEAAGGAVQEKSDALQMKGRRSSANDPLELEADRHADAAALSSQKAQVTEESSPPLIAADGEALPFALRESMESHFGRDFSAVRIHRDAGAHASARALDARAFTSGAHVGFGPGEYAPESPRGRWLLAHELAHVAQQGAAPSRRAGLGVATAAAGAVQLKVKDPKDAAQDEQTGDSVPVSELKTPSGGLREKLPLTPEVLSWVDGMRTGGAKGRSDPQAKPNPKDPSNFPERRQEGAAFVWAEADERPIDPTDVQQGFLGDCYFMSLLAAIAAARPEFIEEIVQERDDGTFAVRFFGPKGERVDEIVEPTFPSYTSTKDPTYAQFGDQSDAFGRELWPMLIEKAWAQKQKGWLSIEGSEKTYQQHARALLGEQFEDVSLPGGISAKDLFGRLHEHFVVKRMPVTFKSFEKKGETKAMAKKTSKRGVISNHGYALQELQPRAKTATLYNPHGPESDHLVGKSMEFLHANFMSVRFYKITTAGAGRAKSGAPTKEESVAKEADPQSLLKDSGYAELVADFKKELAAMSSVMGARAIAQRYGEFLWSKATQRAQELSGADTDDRPLYWARLEMVATLRAFAPKAYRMTQLEQDMLIEILEAASRGRTDIAFAKEKDADERRVLVSGFDPFGFQSGGSRRKANPSGAAVLALDGQIVPAGSGSLRGVVEGVIFPVRFADFDAGIVEKTFGPYLKKEGKDRVDMIMTISQGGSTLDPKATDVERSKAFELEQFAGKRRAPASDNAGATTGKGAKPGELPVGKHMSPGKEFEESSLPRQDIQRALGRGETPAETGVKYSTSEGEKEAASGGVDPKDASKDPKAIEGSGGGYLSNEVFYRTASLRAKEMASEKGKEDPKKKEKPGVPVGHLHVPYLPAPSGEASSEKEHTALRDKIVEWVRRIIAAALPFIGK